MSYLSQKHADMPHAERVAKLRPDYDPDLGYGDRDELHIIETIRAVVGGGFRDYEGSEDGGWGMDIAQAVAEFMGDHGRAFREVRPKTRILQDGRLDIYLERAPILGVTS